MSQESVERFLGRALTDENFRRAAIGSINLAIISCGFTFTKEEIAALESVDWELIDLAAADMDIAIRRSSSYLANLESEDSFDGIPVIAKAV